MEALLRPASEPLHPPPLSLYIHLPWCEKKCPYCDFNSHQSPRILPEEKYVRAVQADLEQAMPQLWGRALHSVFIGGGTPTLFSAGAVDALLASVRMLFNPHPDIEITLEANPSSAEQEKFAALRAAGVNRLSLGVQSFDDVALQRLGRVHTAAEAHAAAEAAKQIFPQFNIDLMHALPHQSANVAIADVQAALRYAPTHLSLYQLTLEPQTPFYRAPPSGLPDSDATAAITDAVADVAAAANYARYEVSAYAKPGCECQHNLNYWQYGDYLGVGAGAHSKITTAGVVRRSHRIKNPLHYIEQSPQAIADDQTVTRADIAFEFMLNALRLTDGFSKQLLSERMGVVEPRFWRRIEQAAADGWLTIRDDHIVPTNRGQRFLNDLTALFLP